MKKFLVIVSVLFATTAAAEVCSAKLQDTRGMTLRSFSGYGYSTSEACKEALQECRYEKRRLAGQSRRYRDASCTVERRRPRPTPVKRTCEFDLKKNNGRTIESFRAKGQTQKNACQKARRKCERELDYRQSNGRNMRAYCQKSFSNGGGNNYDYVTKSCSVDRVNPRGRVVDTHFGSATGRRGTGVKAQACSQAMQQCRRDASYSGRYQTCKQTDLYSDYSSDSFVFGEF
ncbi:MAG: hypothetical protein BM556_18160 [Bacteriovorax sp. MedPE-SWde]|nr:MAG: hypothetical protein BM556_18160 [Bacteriovorax sp. MedPE-SWde]